MSFAAILCDLDGVLVDTGDEVERIWREWAEVQGLDAQAVAHASHGVPAREVIAAVAPHLPAAEEAERVDRLHAASGGAALPGAAELLRDAPPGRLAVVTSCGAPLAAARLLAAELPEPAAWSPPTPSAAASPRPTRISSPPRRWGPTPPAAS